MVVIVTHNGGELVTNLISDVNSFGIPNNEICVVDNKSKDPEHRKLLEALKEKGYNVIYNPESTYEIGAYKLAIANYKADYWYFLQDSIRLKQNIFEMVQPSLSRNFVFTFLWWSDQTYVYEPPIYNFLYKNYGTVLYNKSCFGNMFFATDEVVQLVKDEWGLPHNKWESVANEMGLGIVFEKYNIEVVGLDVCDERVDVANGFDTYPFFTKISKLRQ